MSTDATAVELSILLACKALRIKYDRRVFSFAMIMNEQSNIQRQAALQLAFPRSVLQMAFERLVDASILDPLPNHTSTKVDVAYRMVRLGIPAVLIADIIKNHPSCPDHLRKLAAQQI